MGGGLENLLIVRGWNRGRYYWVSNNNHIQYLFALFKHPQAPNMTHIISFKKASKHTWLRAAAVCDIFDCDDVDMLLSEDVLCMPGLSDLSCGFDPLDFSWISV